MWKSVGKLRFFDTQVDLLWCHTGWHCWHCWTQSKHQKMVRIFCMDKIMIYGIYLIFYFAHFYYLSGPSNCFNTETDTEKMREPKIVPWVHSSPDLNAWQSDLTVQLGELWKKQLICSDFLSSTDAYRWTNLNGNAICNIQFKKYIY